MSEIYIKKKKKFVLRGIGSGWKQIVCIGGVKDEGNERIIYPETFKIARFKRRYSVINNFKIRG